MFLFIATLVGSASATPLSGTILGLDADALRGVLIGSDTIRVDAPERKR